MYRGPSRFLKAEGFEVGLHLMAGLPGDTPERFAATVEAAVTLGAGHD